MASGGISLSGSTSVYPGSFKRGIAVPESKEGKFDSVQLSAASDKEVSFQKQLVSRISQEVRTATTTGDIQSLRQEIQEGSYVLDPMAIAGRILMYMEG